MTSMCPNFGQGGVQTEGRPFLNNICFLVEQICNYLQKYTYADVLLLFLCEREAVINHVCMREGLVNGHDVFFFFFF